MSDVKALFRTVDPTFAPKTKEELAQEVYDIETRVALREGLPFLHGWKWYDWARKFFESTNKINLLCAANQISKSSTQIRKCIDWATNKEKWPELWESKPVQFWYLYPSQDVVNAEWLTKWQQFLPTGKYKDDSYYGWKEMKDGKDITGIKFNSGVYVFFKTYGQKASVLQTGTVDAIFCDEELPVHLYNELMLRINSTNGYFHMVFTATLGQDEWRRAMEPTENEVANAKAGKEVTISEFLPSALKMTVSLYDSQFYEDGTPSKWTFERIKQTEARCSTHKEVLKRVYGRFIVLDGLKYGSFDIKKHIKPKHPVPKSWLVFAGADIGSGGSEGHPSALCYVAVNPNMQEGRVFFGWRGDNIVTTAGDVVKKHIEIKKEKSITTSRQFFDWANKDFDNIATTMNEPFERAEKSHEVGEDIINTLFKNDMMFIYDEPELMKLVGEISVLKKDQDKRKAKDDFADAFRYAVSKIPWDFSELASMFKDKAKDPDEDLTPEQIEVRERRAAFEGDHDEETLRVEAELEEMNEYYG